MILRTTALALLFATTALAQVAQVKATDETDPALTGGDAVDDPAIWIHPTDPAQSLIIGTDKQSGLFTYGLDGKTVQKISNGNTGNVDVRYNFPLGGKSVPLVVTNNRSTNGISVYAVNVATRQLQNVGKGTLPTGMTVYGACLYRSPKTGDYFAFITSKTGVVQQWRLEDDGTGKVTSTKVRQFDVGSQIEACAADDVLGHLYVGEEAVGVWKYDAEPGGGSARTQVDKTGSGGHLTADVEGLAIFYRPDGTGYLVVSSQGNNRFVLYTREGNNSHVGAFTIVDGAVDGVSDCDGVDVTNAALGPDYAEGLLVAQDGSNPGANQSFKLVPWRRIADGLAPNVEVDTRWDPRQVGASSGGVDAGTPPTDAGVSDDAGTETDAGMAQDGGTPADSGTPADAGSDITADAGNTTPVDAGNGGDRTDAGAGDGGSRGPPDSEEDAPVTGCAQAPGSMIALAFVAAAALMGRRRGARLIR